ncbi:MAG: OmpA family protein [Egibacteraceae bacterium]
MLQAAKRERTWLRPVLIGGAVLLGLVLVGLVVIGGGSGGAFRARPCDPGVTQVPDGMPAAAQTVILLDRTRSARGMPGNGGEFNDYAATVEGAMREAVGAGHTVSVAAFDGSSATMRWAGSVTAFRGDSTRRQFHVRDHQECLGEILRTEAVSSPQAEGSDVLGALQAAARQIGPDPAPGSVVIIATDGLVNVGCASVHRAAIADPGQIDQIVDDCRAAGAIPELRNVKVQMVGLGQPGPGRPILSTEQLNWVRDLWAALCAQTRASCDVDGRAVGNDTPPPELPGPAPGDPDPEFPDLRVHLVGSAVVIELPDALLFRFDSAELLAAAPIDRVVNEVRQLKAIDVKVEGHTDSRGEADYNFGLSQQRAEAVAGALRAQGIAVSAVTGFGETRLQNQQEFRPNGTPDLRAMASNRRVQIIVTVPG